MENKYLTLHVPKIRDQWYRSRYKKPNNKAVLDILIALIGIGFIIFFSLKANCFTYLFWIFTYFR